MRQHKSRGRRLQRVGAARKLRERLAAQVDRARELLAREAQLSRALREADGARVPRAPLQRRRGVQPHVLAQHRLGGGLRRGGGEAPVRLAPRLAAPRLAAVRLGVVRLGGRRALQPRGAVARERDGREEADAERGAHLVGGARERGGGGARVARREGGARLDENAAALRRGEGERLVGVALHAEQRLAHLGGDVRGEEGGGARGVARGGGGGVALLQLCGFVACDGEYAELSDETAADRARLAESRAALELALAKAVSRPAFLGPEEVKVFAPGAAESFTRQELSGEAYELSGAEVKAAMAAAAAKREQESVLRTQAQREMEAARRKRVYTKAMIRVRFPDGVTLQGTFSAAAPVSLLCEWVGSALREPGHSFELAVPRGKPLQEMNKTLEQVELVPASLLNFRIHAAEMYDPPFLSEALLARMQQLRPEDQQIPQGRPLVADASEPRAHATPALAAAPRNPKWAPGAK
mmetsp:Transcript_48697/g.120750  ORF Transcript_48697/g.120750 Transcript_48697/m.120750 type:complete len:470 (-) Transcript_48697:85-1494(-)